MPPGTYDRTVKGLSSHFVWTNRSKESLTLDLKHARAQEVLTRPGGARRRLPSEPRAWRGRAARLGAEVLRRKHPRLIWCGISGYGPAGPYARKKAYDLLVQCEAGLLSVTGSAESAGKGRHPGADIAAGMYAFSAVLPR
jgi:itaconate CoA-transferase